MRCSVSTIALLLQLPVTIFAAPVQNSQASSEEKRLAGLAGQEVKQRSVAKSKWKRDDASSIASALRPRSGNEQGRNAGLESQFTQTLQISQKPQSEAVSYNEQNRADINSGRMAAMPYRGPGTVGYAGGSPRRITVQTEDVSPPEAKMPSGIARVPRGINPAEEAKFKLKRNDGSNSVARALFPRKGEDGKSEDEVGKDGKSGDEVGKDETPDLEMGNAGMSEPERQQDPASRAPQTPAGPPESSGTPPPRDWAKFWKWEKAFPGNIKFKVGFTIGGSSSSTLDDFDEFSSLDGWSSPETPKSPPAKGRLPRGITIANEANVKVKRDDASLAPVLLPRGNPTKENKGSTLLQEPKPEADKAIGPVEKITQPLYLGGGAWRDLTYYRDANGKSLFDEPVKARFPRGIAPTKAGDLIAKRDDNPSIAPALLRRADEGKKTEGSKSGKNPSHREITFNYDLGGGHTLPYTYSVDKKGKWVDAPSWQNSPQPWQEFKAEQAKKPRWSFKAPFLIRRGIVSAKSDEQEVSA